MERKIIRGVLVYVNFEGRQIMIHRDHSEKDIHYQKWVASGGGLELGETLDQCAEREVLEELGIKVKPIRRGRVFFNNEGRTFNGQPKDWDYQCEIYTATAIERPRDKTDKGDRVELFDSRDILSLPQHECDKYIWLLSQQKSSFNVEFRYSGENMSSFEVKFE